MIPTPTPPNPNPNQLLGSNQEMGNLAKTQENNTKSNSHNNTDDTTTNTTTNSNNNNDNTTSNETATSTSSLPTTTDPNTSTNTNTTITTATTATASTIANTSTTTTNTNTNTNTPNSTSTNTDMVPTKTGNSMQPTYVYPPAFQPISKNSASRADTVNMAVGTIGSVSVGTVGTVGTVDGNAVSRPSWSTTASTLPPTSTSGLSSVPVPVSQGVPQGVLQQGIVGNASVSGQGSTDVNATINVNANVNTDASSGVLSLPKQQQEQQQEQQSQPEDMDIDAKPPTLTTPNEVVRAMGTVTAVPGVAAAAAGVAAPNMPSQLNVENTSQKSTVLASSSSTAAAAAITSVPAASIQPSASSEPVAPKGQVQGQGQVPPSSLPSPAPPFTKPTLLLKMPKPIVEKQVKPSPLNKPKTFSAAEIALAAVNKFRQQKKPTNNANVGANSGANVNANVGATANSIPANSTKNSGGNTNTNTNANTNINNAKNRPDANQAREQPYDAQYEHPSNPGIRTVGNSNSNSDGNKVVHAHDEHSSTPGIRIGSNDGSIADAPPLASTAMSTNTNTPMNSMASDSVTAANVNDNVKEETVNANVNKNVLTSSTTGSGSGILATGPSAGPTVEALAAAATAATNQQSNNVKMEGNDTIMTDVSANANVNPIGNVNINLNANPNANVNNNIKVNNEMNANPNANIGPGANGPNASAFSVNAEMAKNMNNNNSMQFLHNQMFDNRYGNMVQIRNLNNTMISQAEDVRFVGNNPANKMPNGIGQGQGLGQGLGQGPGPSAQGEEGGYMSMRNPNRVLHPMDKNPQQAQAQQSLSNVNVNNPHPQLTNTGNVNAPNPGHMNGPPSQPPNDKPPVAPTPNNNNNGPPLMRELKVEDALNYLDQVKFAFGDRPKIYNEFLEIMKNFKAHEIDTPGVIHRVSELFRGYNNLILGFNTFLPEGFKIEQKDLEAGGHLAGFGAPRPPQGPGTGPNVNGPMGRFPQQAQQNMGRIRPPAMFPTHQHQQQLQQQQQQQQRPGGMQPNQVHPGHHLPNQSGGGGNVPVSGILHPIPGRETPIVEQRQHEQNMPPHIQKQQQGQHQNLPPHIPLGNQPPTQAPPVPQAMEMPQQSSVHPPQQQQAGGQQPEFDHAISYVTTIKRRFSSEPRTYQQFLEILHTYQKEQRGIREVLEQVSSLFADHPDLLKEFTYFLPEAVQEQAKERLHAAAAEAEARILAARQQQEATKNNAGFDPMQALFPKHRNGTWKDPNAPSKDIVDMTEKKVSAVETQPEPVKASPSPSRKRPHSPAGNVPQQYTSYHMQPEALVYNAGVERQFFDAVKEVLTSFSRDGELAWAIFLKSMDMYAQEVLPKNDMLSMIEDLLGKQHRDLLDEFKRILTAAGAPGAHAQDDAWHSVPLSEIDFSRCRRCTPSYRALPRDYPCPPFSERSEEEAKVLNDVWISLPDGSEESYTFRHMRKNQHEEILFRCEDERFEIDMVIDSNACTLKRLEPIAEEIALLQQKELARKNSQGANGSKSSHGGVGGKLYKYSFDKRILNTIHRHCISRIYGDSGPEMLEVMYKNPVVAVPIVLKRLRQKDKDFRASREVLNRRWKELAEINYYKSIDHRSLTWRTIDKRATSTRTLATDIKDRAANNGIESEAAILLRRDKAKDEHGSFYEVTMGRYLSRKRDLSNLPKPTSALFTPHMSIDYENNSWSQRDAYRIITFALERGSISPMDKDRCHAVWRHFLSKFFGLSLMWMQGPAVAYTSTPHASSPTIVSNGSTSGNDEEMSNGDESGMIDDDMVVTEEVMKGCKKGVPPNDSHILDQQPVPPGALVLTVFGEGTVIKYHRSDQIYEIALPFGAVGYLNRNAVLCSILPIKTSSLTEELMSSDEKGLEREDDMLILGPQCLYLFFRLHQILIRRLNIARKLAYSVDNDKTLSTLVEHISPDGNVAAGQKRYEAFLSLVYGLVEGSYTSSFPGSSNSTAEGGKYEDRLRCLLGHNSYELATMDKLISHLLKNLQNMANDNTMQEMIQIFRRQQANGGFKPIAFKQEAAMASDGENMFAFQYCKIPKSDKTIMHMDFLGCITEAEERETKSTSMHESSERGEGTSSKKQRRG